MSRSISIGYFQELGGAITSIELRNPYELLGTQDASMKFWSIVAIKKIGITRLSELGHTDPIYFTGWDMMAELGSEIMLLQKNLHVIEFMPEVKAKWLSNLVYAYHLLIETAPKDSIPTMCIG